MTSNVSLTPLDHKAIDTARVLAADAVEKVGNGHPGTAISLAPAAYLLFQRYLRHNPAEPQWVGRDRFVLSIGHSSVTLYNQLFLSGYGLELEDLQSLRTWDSKTPGHPEYGHTDGVEITTGPLGQGFASAVGMAMAARRERGLFDPEAAPGESPFDHTIWVFAGDGDLQEGVTQEASSLAGHQRLGNLVVIYDDNQISIEDDTAVAFSEDIPAKYEALGWHTITVDWTQGGQGYKEDLGALAQAFDEAKAEADRPTLISLKTIIGWPSPTKQNTGAIHGSALGGTEVAALKEALGFDPDKSFDVDPEVLAHARQVMDRGAETQQRWQEQFDAWRAANPKRGELFDRLQARELPAGWHESLPTFTPGDAVATRAASGKVLSSLADVLPELWGGSADLAGSNNTTMAGEKSFLPRGLSTDTWHGDEYGRTLHFGIREHAMGAIVNGIVLHGPTRAYGGTFLVFSDYMRPAVRLAALMHIPSIFVWTHDSIGLGEDGPTHQPIEHLSALRAIPGLDIVRPADANEVVWAWRTVLERDSNPAGIALTRQNVPVFARVDSPATSSANSSKAQADDTAALASASGVARGGYVLSEAANGKPQAVILATGSEVELALLAQQQLAQENTHVRVVSMPCLEWFEEQDVAYRSEVIPPQLRARVSVEAGLALPWYRYVGDLGETVSLEGYGASADYKTLYREFGITVEAVVSAVRKTISNQR